MHYPSSLIAQPALRARSVVAGVAFLQLALFTAIAATRYVDGDEGSYLAAAALVYDGSLPYVDFLYPQTPLLPYVYGAWAAITSESWFAARFLSAVFAATTGTLLYVYLRGRTNGATAAIGTALYATSVLVLTWYPLVKTYALSTMLLFAAFLLVDRERPLRQHWALAGVLLGLAASVRIMFVAPLPVFLLVAARKGRGAAMWRLAGGFAVGLLPMIVFIGLDPGRFVFANLGIHGQRSEAGLVGDIAQKVRVAENLLGVSTPSGAVPQFAILLACAVVAAGVALRRRQFPLAFGVAAALGVANFLPTPTYPQYFCTLVPFLVAGVLRWPLTSAFVVPAAIGVAVYALIGAADTIRMVRSFPDQRIGTVERVGDVIEQRTSKGDAVISSWPGYLFGTDARPYAGLESDFAPHNAASMSPEAARRHHLATAREVEEAIVSGRANLLVVKMWHDLGPFPDWSKAVTRGGYRLVVTIAPAGRAEVGGPVQIYERGR